MKTNMKALVDSKRLIKSFGLLIAVVSLSACVSKPRHVEAETQLVQAQDKYSNVDELPSEYWEALNLPSSRYIEHPKFNIRLGPIYTSALGAECRVAVLSRKQVINFSDYRSQSRVFCSKLINDAVRDADADNESPTKSWYIIKSLRDIDPEIEL